MSSDTLPKPETAPDTESDFNPFLNVADIGKKPGARASLTLTGTNRRLAGQYGPQVVCEVTLGKKTFDWGITINKPNYRILYERFGAKLPKWKGVVQVERRAPARPGQAGFLAIVQANAVALPAQRRATGRSKKRR